MDRMTTGPFLESFDFCSKTMKQNVSNKYNTLSNQSLLHSCIVFMKPTLIFAQASCVDSIPRRSLIIIDPKYWAKDNTGELDQNKRSEMLPACRQCSVTEGQLVGPDQ